MGLKVRQICSLLDIPKSSLYYKPKPEDESIIRHIQQIALQYPHFGYRRITAMLKRQGIHINPKKVYRLCRMMNITPASNLPKGSLSPHVDIPKPEHINHIWAADIFYDRLSSGLRKRTKKDLFSRK